MAANLTKLQCLLQTPHAGRTMLFWVSVLTDTFLLSSVFGLGQITELEQSQDLRRYSPLGQVVPMWSDSTWPTAAVALLSDTRNSYFSHLHSQTVWHFCL